MINKTSMSYWLPKITELPIPIPRTVLIKAEYGEGMDYLSKETHIAVENAATKMGYPCFIKTDLCAGKHAYLNTCYIKNVKTLHRNLERLRDDNFCCDQLFEYIAVREFIPLAWKFKAFNDLPIAPERRYFIEGGKVVCYHPYWPEDAIEFFNLTPKNPRGETGSYTEGIKYRNFLAKKRKEECIPLLREMNKETPDEIKLLTAYAELVSEVLPGYWSVDFALGQNGNWYLIDMAEGDKSWHQDDCIVKQKRNEL